MSESIIPIPFDWDGEALRPAGHRWAKEADKHYVIGERYLMAPFLMRSSASHNHYFAALATAWRNLPDSMAIEFPSIEHLRKYALIKAGYADSRQFVAASKAEAQRLAVFLRPCDEYAIVTFSECVVTEWRAQSQSYRAMGKERFEASKGAVLDIVARMIGVTASQIAEQS